VKIVVRQKEVEIIEQEYLFELQRIKNTINENQNKAMVIVNSAAIINNYEIGTIINERKVWGNKYIEKLANDLKNYGKGYSKRNLEYMTQLANNFTFEEITKQLVSQIPWGSIVKIMQKSKTHEEMIWYINQTYKNSWTRSMVMNQFSLRAYERSLIEPTTTEIVNASNDDLVNELFKDTYVFDFLDRNKIKSEKDLKNQMIENVLKLLQELGPGFSLVGKEYKLTTPTEEEFYIDLLMYHTKIHAYVVIEVKIGKFQPADFGQLVFYVNAVDELEKMDNDEATIGLLLCKEADTFVAQTTLKKSYSKIGVSKYKFIEELPEYLRKKLNKL
jgi:predicted nuclease of restriction endonuclease-like (RecB) superfamily